MIFIENNLIIYTLSLLLLGMIIFLSIQLIKVFRSNRIFEARIRKAEKVMARQKEQHIENLLPSDDWKVESAFSNEKKLTGKEDEEMCKHSCTAV